jgi:MSHA pilin protein MshC
MSFTDCNERGFTLIELIAVIIILGILTAVIGPRFFSNTTFSARGYADELASAIRYTQATAINSGCASSLNITATAYVAQQRALSASALPPCATSGAWSVPVLRADGSAVSGTRPTGVTVAHATRITFDPQGRVTGAAPPVLLVSGFSITIDPQSGLVSVQ